jgi:hypothetical protein
MGVTGEPLIAQYPAANFSKRFPDMKGARSSKKELHK